jgi:predicted PurR-regulated permease PerM
MADEQGVRSEQPVASAPSPVFSAGGIFIALAALYFGRDIFVPFALAILLAFALAPLVDWLRSVRVPRIAAVLLAVSVAVLVISGVSLLVGGQLVELAASVPTYKETISTKLRSLRSIGLGQSAIERVTHTVEDLSREFTDQRPGPAPQPSAPAAQGEERRPVPVVIEQPEMRPLEVIRTIAGPLIAPLATAGMVIVFVIFVLIERTDLRDRFIRLVGHGDLQKSTSVLNDAAERVSRYLLMQLVVNISYGVPVGIGLYLIGVPNALLWGLLATVLRFIPYLGPFLAALFPTVLAFAIDPGWTMLLWVIALFVVIELIINNAIEPWLYGSSTGLSSLAIILAAVFWTTLWGPVGLFLATPLTVCLVVMGRYIPQLEFLGVLLGSDPVLAPEERFYQRLLAGNVEEAIVVAETEIDETSPMNFLDHVVIPTLRLAENDRQRGTANPESRAKLADDAIFVIQELEDELENLAATGPDSPVICVGGRTELDHAAAEAAVAALRSNGIAARATAPLRLSRDPGVMIDLTQAKVICLCYLDTHPQAYARFLARRLRRQAPEAKTLLCYLNPPPGPPARNLAEGMLVDKVVFTLVEAVAQTAEWLGVTIVEPQDEAPEEQEQRGSLLQTISGIASS